jgi:hypothetical protein
LKQAENYLQRRLVPWPMRLHASHDRFSRRVDFKNPAKYAEEYEFSAEKYQVGAWLRLLLRAGNWGC